MLKQSKKLVLIYVLLSFLLILIVCNFQDFKAYLLLHTSKSIYILFNFLTVGIILLMFFYYKNKIRQAEKNISAKNYELHLDNMTTVFNKKGLEQYGKDKWELARKKKTTFAIYFIDIDKFKQLNDTYGHQIGDMVIKEVAFALKKSVRLDTDLIIRYGGDEFLIIVSDIVKDTIHIITRRIQKNMNDIKIDAIKDKITLSIGILFMNKITENDQFDNAITISDEALYKTKKEGGNNFHLVEK